MSAKSPAITIAGAIVYERLRREVITVEACDAAVELVYRLWESRGMFDGPESIGCEFCGAHPTEPCTTGEGPCFWRFSNWRRARNDAAERETVSEFAAPMVRIFRDSAVSIDRRTEAGL